MTPPPAGALAPEHRPAPRPRPERRRDDHLRPVRQRTVRRSPAVPVLVGAGIVIAALFALAVMHALLIGGQLRLDEMQRDVAAETEEIHRLRLRVAELESPDRILEVARQRLGMVQPAEVGYLAPVEVDTGDAGLTRVAPAEVPPAEDPEDGAATDGPADAEDAEDGEDAEDAEDPAAGDASGEEATAVEHAPEQPVAGGGDE